ncbi:MAG: hypothetical protein LC646_00830 [Xanthomonadaceae bacterium]|nr:hypothetical protein [Xanthomonadaceae bacterium]
MILSKLFSKRKETKTKMSMTEVLLSSSDSGNEPGLAEKTGTGRIKNDQQSDGHNERRDKSIINPAKGNMR